MTETAINNIHAYLAKYYDGQPREFLPEQEAAFDTAFHDDLRFISFGNSSAQNLAGGRVRTKADRKLDEVKFMKLGTVAKELDDSYQVIDEHHIRWKAYFKNEKVETTRDCLATVKDGKLAVVEPYNEASALKPVLRKYLATYDGTVKDFSEMQPVFEELFHDDVQMLVVAEDKVLDKAKIKEAITELLSRGTKLTEAELNVLDESHLELKAYVKNENDDKVIHNRFTVKDGKVKKLERIDPEV